MSENSWEVKFVGMDKELKLIQLPSIEIAENLIDEEAFNYFCGMKDDYAAITIKDKTYMLGLINTQNSFVFAEREGSCFKVKSLLNEYIDLKEIEGNRERLIKFLEEEPYELAEEEDGVSGLNEREMLCVSQTSPSCLKIILEDVCGFKINGRYRVLSSNTKNNLLRLTFSICFKNKLNLNRIDKKYLLNLLFQIKEIPTVVSECFILWLFCIDGSIDKKKVLEILIGSLFISETNKEKTELLQELRIKLPSYLSICEEDFFDFGFFDYDEKQRKEFFYYFPLSRLPNDPREAIFKFFEFKSVWKEENLFRYAESLFGKKKESFLIGMCRKVLILNKVCYVLNGLNKNLI